MSKPTLTLPLVAGKKYVRRDGQIVTLSKGCSPDFPFDYTLPDGMRGNLTATGRWCHPSVGGASPVDLVADYIEPPKPQGHPHAELMALYAEDAAETDKPWLRWEMRHVHAIDGAPWVTCRAHPDWSLSGMYRRKVKTIRIGEFDIHPDDLFAVKDQIEALFGSGNER